MIFQAASWCGSKKMAGRAMSKVGPVVRPGRDGPTGKAARPSPRALSAAFGFAVAACLVAALASLDQRAQRRVKHHRWILEAYRPGDGTEP